MTAIHCNWIDHHHFRSEHGGYAIHMDGDNKKGHGPKALLLSGLAGCSGIDVVDILEKMRVVFSEFSIEVSAQLSDEHPKVFTHIEMVYSVKMNKRDEDKLIKAIELSLEKYCGVAAMLKKNCPIDYKVVIH